MGIENLIKIAFVLTIAAALTGQLPRVTYQVRLAQVKLLREARASNWGSPDILSH